jgi:hypothetical protein
MTNEKFVEAEIPCVHIIFLRIIVSNILLLKCSNKEITVCSCKRVLEWR